MSMARAMRDECWRQGWLQIDGPQNVVNPEFQNKIPAATGLAWRHGRQFPLISEKT